MGKFPYSLGQPTPFRPRIRAGGLLFHPVGARVVGVGAAVVLGFSNSTRAIAMRHRGDVFTKLIR
jgi:hypothetical protein